MTNKSECAPISKSCDCADPKKDFKKTEAYRCIHDFIFLIDHTIKKNKNCASLPVSDPFIPSLRAIVENTPLSTKHARFANEAMRDVIEQVAQLVAPQRKDAGGIVYPDNEFSEGAYLKEAFGNGIRMDFGTGHELNFLCYLFVRYKRGLLTVLEVPAVLAEYFRIIRLYIKKFNIEAAGARGVWSIDDYQLLPFLFGSSENFDSPFRIMDIPSGIFHEAWAAKEAGGMLASVCELGWQEINVNLIKMYDREVLSKFVVTQHFIYSSYLPSDYIG